MDPLPPFLNNCLTYIYMSNNKKSLSFLSYHLLIMLTEAFIGSILCFHVSGCKFGFIFLLALWQSGYCVSEPLLLLTENFQSNDIIKILSFTALAMIGCIATLLTLLGISQLKGEIIALDSIFNALFMSMGIIIIFIVIIGMIMENNVNIINNVGLLIYVIGRVLLSLFWIYIVIVNDSSHLQIEYAPVAAIGCMFFQLSIILSTIKQEWMAFGWLMLPAITFTVIKNDKIFN